MDKRTSRNGAVDRLKKLRETMGLTQREMGELFGVVHGAIALWEGGKRRIPGPVLRIMELYEAQLGLSPPPDPAAAHPLDAIQASWVRRNLKLTATGTYIVGQMALLGIRNIALRSRAPEEIQTQAYTAIGRRLVETLGQMKGLAQKLGQIISYMNFHLPAELRAQLADLQRISPPMTPAAIAEQIVAAFGRTPPQLFREWSPQPFAAASIGQVHRARLPDGTAVAVKVQYPGIQKVLAADFKNAAALEHVASLFIRGHSPGTLIQEIRERVTEECDYTIEAASQERFRQAFAADPRFVIPRVHPEFSRRTVLTSDLLAGQTLRDFARTATADERNRAAEALWDFAMAMLFRHRIFSGDPHPGNFLFLPDGRIGCVDFGCVKTMDDAVDALWRQFIRGVIHEDRRAVREAIMAFAYVPDPDRFDHEHFYQLMRLWYEPWWRDAPFRFSEAQLAEVWQRMAFENPNTTQMHFPRSTLYLNQLMWGLHALMAALDAESNWARRVRAYL